MNPESTSPPSKERPIQASIFFQLQIVFGVAFIIATLFTAWTEPGLMSGFLTERVIDEITSSQLQPTPPFLPLQPSPTARPTLRVGIVAGHSGNDPGAVCSEELGGYREVDINLAIANLTREYLITEGYEVDLLAEFDQRLIGYRALALVSIHADSCQYINDQATGFKVASALSTNYPEQATRLTNCLRARYASVTNLPFHPGSVTADMTSYHAFGEIDSQTPAAIIEVGFMNLDRLILTQQPDLLARGITDGLLCFLRNESINLEPTNTP
jgi:N-acetylmuramoyl-L-alanine amidase